ncbi:hypothetical protein C2E23DRAFT_879867 [Lenzites betulinus]|nr:hypothetical protein C2E23DRAFT_879867 [Lenzites betulinus]
MLRSTYAYAPSHSSELLQKNGPSDDHYSEGIYMPNLSSDVFLFSPSLCSRPSQDSATQSSSSFDALSYMCSPTDRSASASIFSPSALPTPARSRSPTFVDTYQSIREGKPITRLSPSTPFQRLFDSSPGGYWQAADDLSESPISRQSGAMHTACLGSEQEQVSDEEDEDAPISGKIESLLAYKQSQDILDSPQAVDRCSSPSSLSSLSSRSSSPAFALSTLPFPSSQTSLGRAPSCTRTNNQGPVSALGSPLKMSSPYPAVPSHAPYIRRSTRLRPIQRTTRTSLAAEILNQLGRPLNGTTLGLHHSSPLKLSSSPTRTTVDSDDENYDPASGPHRQSRKRGRVSVYSSPSRKKQRGPAATARASAAGSGDPTTSSPDDAAIYPNRTFPLSVPIHENFLLFYRRFPVSSVIDGDLATAHRILIPRAQDGIPNPPRDALDLYTPRFVKGRGTSKVGLCPICHESTDRGGEGKKIWLSMKFSAFNYHMQYAHGISPATGRPFSPPLAFRIVPRPNAGKLEKTKLMEGRCHRCKKWVAIEGIKDVPTKVREIFWWKHAATCHQGSTIEGEGDVFVEDAVYEAVSSMADAEGETDDDEDETEEQK